jgi:hypothetical protein
MDEPKVDQAQTKVDQPKVDQPKVDQPKVDQPKVCPEKTKLLLEFLNKGQIACATLSDLNGLLLPRELFLNDILYKQLKEHIPELKQLFSSSYLTALQAPAEEFQKWPHLNLMRQVLRSCHFKLTPKRVSNGYTADGKKKYKRMFIIEQMRVI